MENFRISGYGLTGNGVAPTGVCRSRPFMLISLSTAVVKHVTLRFTGEHGFDKWFITKTYGVGAS